MVGNSNLIAEFLKQKKFLAQIETDMGFLVRDISYLDPEDVFQEAISRALKNQHAFRGSNVKQARAWIRTIAVNFVRDQLRKSSKTSQHVTSDAEHFQDNDDFLRSFEDSEILKHIFQRLSSTELQFLKARYKAGMSFETIATILETTPAAVRQRHLRLLKKVRRMIDEQ